MFTINTYQNWPLGIRGQVWFLMGRSFGGVSGALLGTSMDLLVRGVELGIVLPLAITAKIAENYRTFQ
ncbi:MAG: hypothetical protein WA118_13850 [Carboxydocellales bacterium]